MRRVVVTGLGIVNSLGTGVDLNWSRLLDGQSGIRKLEGFDEHDLPAKIGGTIPLGDGSDGTFNAEEWVPTKDQRRMDTFIIYGLAAAIQAIEDSGWKPEAEEDQWKTGVLIGSGIGGLPEIAGGAITVHEGRARRLSPFFIPASLINLVSGHVSIRYGLKGPNHAVVTACSTGAHAVSYTHLTLPTKA